MFPLTVIQLFAYPLPSSICSLTPDVACSSQAAPYLLFLPVVPVHYFTHVFLLFFSGVWATNIHDSVVIDVDDAL